MDTDTYEKNERKITRDKIVRTIVWVVGIVLILLILPGLVATVWVPSCTTCHNSQDFVEQTAERPHGSIKCTVCHGGAGGKEALLYRQAVIYQMAIPILGSSSKTLAHVSSDTCRECHGDIYQGTTVSNGIKIKHDTCAPKGASSCVGCHSTVVHGTLTIWPSQYDMVDCLSCHAREGVVADQGCSLCHEGSYQDPAPTVGTAFKATHGINWEKTHGMGNLDTCMACHPRDYCAPCHGKAVPHPVSFLMTHGGVADTPDSKCDTCHKNSTFCDKCHGITMPHPSGFLQNHSREIGTLGETLCYNCHVRNDCEGCHAAHIHPGGATP